MDELRRPIYIVAVCLLVAALLLEMGSASILNRLQPQRQAGAMKSMAAGALADFIPAEDIGDVSSQAESESKDVESPPGIAIGYLALMDGMVVFSVALITLQIIGWRGFLGRTQGVPTLIVSLIILIVGIILIFLAIVKVMIMFGLLTAAPFGTIAYFAIWGFFNRGGAATVLGIVMLLKLGFAACLIASHPGFLKNKGLVLAILTSLLGGLIISFLHGFVPGFLASITDVVAAIIVAILAVIWSVVMLIGSIISLFKAPA